MEQQQHHARPQPPGSSSASPGAAPRAADAPRYPFSLVVEHAKESLQQLMRRYRRPHQQKGAAITFAEQLFMRYEGVALVSVLAYVLLKFCCDAYMHQRSTELARRDELVEQFELQCQGSLTRLKQMQSSLHFWSAVQARSRERVQRWHLQHQVDELRDQVDALQHTQQQQQQGQGPHQHQHQVVTVVEVAPWWHRLLPRWRSRRKEHEDAQPGSGGAAREEEEEEKERVGDAAEAPPATEDSTPAAAEPEVAGWAQSLNDIPALLLRAGGVLMDVGGAVGVESPGEEHEQQQQQRSEEEAGLGEEERERRRAARLTQGLSERDASARLALRLGLPALVAAAPATAPPDASSGGGGGPPSPSGPAEQGLAAPAHGDEEEDKGDEQQCGGRGTAASSSSHRRSGALEAHAQWQKVAATCEQQIALLVARHAMEMHYLFESEAQLSHWRRYAARELVFETGWGAPPWLARWAGLEGVEEGRRGVGTAQEGGPGPEGGGGGRQELSVRVRVWWPLWEAGEAEERAAESQSTWDAVWHAVGVDQ